MSSNFDSAAPVAWANQLWDEATDMAPLDLAEIDDLVARAYATALADTDPRPTPPVVVVPSPLVGLVVAWFMANGDLLDQSLRSAVADALACQIDPGSTPAPADLIGAAGAPLVGALHEPLGEALADDLRTRLASDLGISSTEADRWLDDVQQAMRQGLAGVTEAQQALLAEVGLQAGVGSLWLGQQLWRSLATALGRDLTNQLTVALGPKLRTQLFHAWWWAAPGQLAASGPWGLADGSFLASSGFRPSEQVASSLTAAKEALRLGCWWPLESVCIVSQRVASWRVDDRRHLHAADGPAIVFQDRWAISAWEGERVPGWIIADTYDVARLTQARAAERRLAVRRSGGWTTILARSAATEIDRTADQARPEQELVLYDCGAGEDRSQILAAVDGSGIVDAWLPRRRLTTAAEAATSVETEGEAPDPLGDDPD